jgi:uncharacterized membrane protein (UPF0127 family)
MAEAPIRVKQTNRAALLAKILLAVMAVGLLAAVVPIKGCQDTAGANVQSVKVGGKWFHLEVAADEPTRMKGLGQRDHIEPDGGMLFVFNNNFPRDFRDGSAFVMRDCPVDIDILYLDPNGRVVKMYAMKAEPPRGADGKDEGKVGEFGETPGGKAYEDRLKKYPSVYPFQFAIELKGGTLEQLKGKVHEGDKIDLPLDDLKRRAK